MCTCTTIFVLICSDILWNVCTSPSWKNVPECRISQQQTFSRSCGDCSHTDGATCVISNRLHVMFVTHSGPSLGLPTLFSLGLFLGDRARIRSATPDYSGPWFISLCLFPTLGSCQLQSIEFPLHMIIHVYINTILYLYILIPYCILSLHIIQ